MAPTPTPDVVASDRETRRLAALERLRILDTLPEQTYDDVVRLASQICGTPIALISLVDADRQWFKAKVGLDADETGRDVAFCAHAIDSPDQMLTVDDALLDQRFATNPLVVGDPQIRFYAGAPIVTREGHALGTVCVIDTVPRHLDDAQRDALQALARHTSMLLDLRDAARDASQNANALHDLNESLERRVERRTRERDRLWDLSVDLLVLMDEQGRLLRVSPSWTQVLGHAESALLGTRYRDRVHPDDQHAFDSVIAAMRDAPVHFEHRVAMRDGDWRWFAWTLSPEPGGQRLTGIGRDVTAIHTQRIQLEVAESALRQSQKMEAVGQLTGGIAHDFNNLLSGITGNLELLRLRVAQGRHADLDRYAKAAQGSAHRAAALTHRLLAFARRQTLEPRPTDPHLLVRGLEDMIRRTSGPHIELDVAGGEGLWAALVDPHQLENALLNLCINARDAMPEGGRLSIEIANRMLDHPASFERDLPSGEYVTLSITDTGTGMTADVAQRAFDPFFTTKPLGAGTGLGLSMVYGFARQSNGQVRIHSEVGRGTTVRLYLPRHAEGAGMIEAESKYAMDEQARAGETVLIVDDEETVRELITEVMRELGYRTLARADGAEGLAVLQSKERVDLLITDVGLPGGMNGRQVADAGRTLRPALRVLFITGYAEGAITKDGMLEAGMGILIKPFTIETLARRVQDMIAPPVA